MNLSTYMHQNSKFQRAKHTHTHTHRINQHEFRLKTKIENLKEEFLNYRH